MLRPALGPLQPSLQALLVHKLVYNTHSTCVAEAFNEAADRRGLIAPNGAKLRLFGVELGSGSNWRAPPGLGLVGRVVRSRLAAAEGA